ncbi:bis-aminopropyl spermidine synthase family protein [Bacillus cereus]|uniref:Putative methyltransferase n=1 Tax=Bacillus cereus TaxID=1396 RepID=A0A2A9A088_BACCE|nr:bis-aminopropyl spermidine synthase family protein [Bacillus cereus]PFE13348.1 putative methyltransferase [Bacillus cereus]
MKENKIILLYERFIELDYEEELDKVPKLKNKGVLLNFWKKWYEISEKQFEFIIWKSINTVDTLDDLVKITGTLSLALRLLKVLKERNLVEIIENKIRFSQDLTSSILYEPTAFPNTVYTNKINKKNYAQFKATWDSSLRRAEIINQELSSNKNIFFCGDDDYTSLALKQYKNREISVGDIDEELIENLKYTNNDINFYNFDVRNEVIEDLRNKYDAIHCDPIDDGRGLDLWLNRANELLKGQKGDIIFLKVSVKRLGNRTVYLQNFLTSLGFYLKEIIHDLSSYKVAEEPYIDEELIKKDLDSIGFSKGTFQNLYIQTDMLVFVRLIDKPTLFPQEYYEIRRKI